MKVLLTLVLSLAFWGFNAQANDEHKDAGQATCSKTQEDHTGHKHGGKDCKHKAVKHGSHMDYEHDGHKHMAHGDHYDECKG
jgi:hypothetical protein